MILDAGGEKCSMVRWRGGIHQTSGEKKAAYLALLALPRVGQCLVLIDDMDSVRNITRTRVWHQIVTMTKQQAAASPNIAPYSGVFICLLGHSVMSPLLSVGQCHRSSLSRHHLILMRDIS